MIFALLLTLSLASLPEELTNIELRDLSGEGQRVLALSGEPVVVMVVTARRLRNLKGWERDLRQEFEGLSFVRVADVPEEPPLTHEAVARKLARRVPDEISVLIDIERSWARELELDTSRPNLLLFDRQGKLVAREYGLAQPERVEAFAAKIRALVSEP